METNNGGNVNNLHSDPLDLARHFSGSGVRVPVEIVEANGETVVLDEGRNDHGGQDESMEITVEEMPTADNLTETLGQVRSSMGLDLTHSNGKITTDHSTLLPIDSTQLTPSKSTEVQPLCSLASSLVHDSSSNIQTHEVPSSINSLSSLGITFDATSSMDPQLTLQQMSQHFQEVSRSLRSEGIEISPETIASHFPPSLAETLAASIMNQSSSAATTLLDSGTQGLQIGNISYSDLADVTRVMNATLDPSLTVTSSPTIPSSSGIPSSLAAVFTESDMMPSSPDSNFDTNELLNSDLGHDEEVTSKLANAGPVGMNVYTLYILTITCSINCYCIQTCAWFLYLLRVLIIINLLTNTCTCTYSITFLLHVHVFWFVKVLLPQLLY